MQLLGLSPEEQTIAFIYRYCKSLKDQQTGPLTTQINSSIAIGKARLYIPGVSLIWNHNAGLIRVN